MSIEYTYPPQNAHYAQAMADIASGATANSPPLFGNGLSFKDVIDAVNPLQQLPVVGSIYRAITGDTLSAASQMAGGAIFGGPLGFMMGAINAGLEAATGADVGGHVMAALEGSPAGTQFAAAAYQKTQNLA